MSGGRLAAAVVGLLVAGALAACSPVASSATLPEGVTVELVQLRSDVAGRTAQVRVTNELAADLTVTSLVVEDPRFAAPAIREKQSVVGAGRTVALRFELPEVACSAPGGEAISSDGAASLTLSYTTANGSVTATTDLAEPLGFVSRLHDHECLREQLQSVVNLEWTEFAPSAPGAPATLTLELTPDGPGSATLLGIRTTNLLKFTADGDDDLSLDATVHGSDGASAIAVPLVPWRCDPHAVQEDKRGTVFTIDVEVDGRSGPIEVAASEELRGDILAWVAQWCGFAE